MVLVFVIFTVFTEAGWGTATRPLTKTWLRLKDPISHLRIDPRGRYLAYTDSEGADLRILNLKNQDIYLVSQNYVGASFFWSPDGFRLFFREMQRIGSAETASNVYAFDTKLLKRISIDRHKNTSGLLTYDPRDQKFSFIVDRGIRNHRLNFPGERHAVWQLSAKPSKGKYLASQKAMLWVVDYGVVLQRLEDDGSGIESFQISPDGNAATWATKAGRIYVSESGSAPRHIDDGRDPVWHPTRVEILYAAARKTGAVVTSYDLKINSLDGHESYLTTTQQTSERWPNWDPDGKTIVYTTAQSSDLYRIEFVK